MWKVKVSCRDATLDSNLDRKCNPITIKFLFYKATQQNKYRNSERP